MVTEEEMEVEGENTTHVGEDQMEGDAKVDRCRRKNNRITSS